MLLFKKFKAAILLLFLQAVLLSPYLCAREIKDLALGVALYEYYQQHHFKSLSEILIAEYNNQLHHQQDFASLFAIGIMLSYGMDIEATLRLEQIENSSDDVKKTADNEPENVARSKYFLAKLYYRKGEFEKASKLLSQTDSAITPGLLPELDYLLDSSQLKRHSDSAKDYVWHKGISEPLTMPRVNKLDMWGLFKKYNQSIATKTDTASNQDKIDALNLLMQQLLKHERKGFIDHSLSNQSEQHKQYKEGDALLDKVKLSLAHLYFNNNQFDQAAKYLNAYSEDGIESSEALLALGWAYFQMQQFDQALAAWLQLYQNDPDDFSAKNALLGIASVYQAKGDKKYSIQAYQKAIQEYEKELEKINEFKQQFSVPNQYDLKSSEWFAVLSSLSSGWLDETLLKNTEDNESRHINQNVRLKRLLSQNDFIYLVNQYKDILWLQELVGQWQQKLSAMGQSIDNQLLRFTEVYSEETLQSLEDQYKGLLLSNQYLESQIEEVKQQKGNDFYLQLMTQKEKNNYAKASTVYSKTETITKSYNDFSHEAFNDDAINKTIKQDQRASRQINKIKQQHQMARLMKGYMIWHVAEESPLRFRHIDKDLTTSNQTIETIKNQLEALDKLVLEQRFQSTSLQRVGDLNQRRKILAAKLKGVSKSVESKIIDRILNELELQKVVVTDYLGQAYFAKANLLDELYQARQTDLSIDINKVQ